MKYPDDAVSKEDTSSADVRGKKLKNHSNLGCNIGNFSAGHPSIYFARLISHTYISIHNMG